MIFFQLAKHFFEGFIQFLLSCVLWDSLIDVLVKKKIEFYFLNANFRKFKYFTHFLVSVVSDKRFLSSLLLIVVLLSELEPFPDVDFPSPLLGDVLSFSAPSDDDLSSFDLSDSFSLSVEPRH